MEPELLIPGVQHGEEAEFRAEVSRIASDFKKCFRTGAEQQIVDDFLISLVPIGQPYTGIAGQTIAGDLSGNSFWSSLSGAVSSLSQLIQLDSGDIKDITDIYKEPLQIISQEMIEGVEQQLPIIMKLSSTELAELNNGRRRSRFARGQCIRRAAAALLAADENALLDQIGDVAVRGVLRRLR
jgi:hypothetical protein